METACYGRPNGPSVSVQVFHERASSNYKEKGIFPYCPQCSEIVELYGVHNWGISRFDHKNRAEDLDPLDDCPSANRGDSRFAGMAPDAWDYERGRQLRQAFFEDDNLKSAYVFCRSLARTGNMPLSKFRSMIQRADRKKIWSYADIPLWLIPYILLTLENFTQAASEKTKGYEFHFVFVKPRGTTASALWNQQIATSLKKVFSNGSEVQTADNPYPLSEEDMRQKAQDTSWITVDFLRLLKKSA